MTVHRVPGVCEIHNELWAKTPNGYWECWSCFKGGKTGRLIRLTDAEIVLAIRHYLCRHEGFRRLGEVVSQFSRAIVKRALPSASENMTHRLKEDRRHKVYRVDGCSRHYRRVFATADRVCVWDYAPQCGEVLAYIPNVKKIVWLRPIEKNEVWKRLASENDRLAEARLEGRVK